MSGKRKSAYIALSLSAVSLSLDQSGMNVPLVFLSVSHGATSVEIGWLTSFSLLVQMISMPFWGGLSDKIGRRPVVLFGLIGSIVSLAFAGISPNFLGIFSGRILSAFFVGSLAVVAAAFADAAKSESQVKLMAIFESSTTFGIFIIGPLLAGALMKISFAAPFFCAALIAVFALAFCWFGMALDGPTVIPGRKTERQPFSIRIRALYEQRNVAGGVILMLVLGVASAATALCYTFLARDRIGLTPQTIGFVYLYAGSIVIAVNQFFAAPLARKFGPVKPLVIGATFLGVAMFINALMGKNIGANLPMALIEKGIWAIGWGLTFPSLAAIVIQGVPVEKKGVVLGIYRSAQSMGRMTAPAGAMLYETLGFFVVFLYMSILYFIAALMTAIYPWNKPTATRNEV